MNGDELLGGEAECKAVEVLESGGRKELGSGLKIQESS